ncbi:MAG: STAS domain-containing protein [Pseudomonadota bacterium]
MALDVTITQKADGAYIVSPIGSLDTASFQTFDQQVKTIIDAGATLVVLDMGQLKYISSIGVRSIMLVRNGVTKRGGKVLFMNLQPQIKKVFDIIKAIPSMQIFSSVAELDEYLDAMQKSVLQSEGE